MRRIPLNPLVDYWGRPGPLDWSAVFGRPAPLVVEVGFGRGEHLVRWAQTSPDRNVVGIEVAWASIQRTLRRIHRAGVGNVRVLYANAEWALYYLWSRSSVERIVSLFPDPWPKARHVGHRLFSRRFFLRAHRVLQEGGVLLLATDDPGFVEWSLSECPRPGFQAHVETYRGELRFGTKYEMKWYQAGRTFFVVEFRKTGPLDVPEPEWPPAMRTYQFPGPLDPSRWAGPEKWSNGDVVVVFKEFVWDPVRRVGLWKTVIHEDTIVQNLWIEVRWVGDRWRLLPSDGCKFLPTYGLQKALDVLAESLGIRESAGMPGNPTG